MKYLICRMLIPGLMMAAAGCGGTTTGNPIYGDITLHSSSYNNTGALFRTLALVAPLVVTEFKFCATQVKLESEEGGYVTKDGAEAIEAVMGLIDVSNQNSTTSWGTINVPVGFRLRELDVEIHRDPENCSGADYSVIYNGSKLTKDLEFKFQMTSVVDLQAGDSFTLVLTQIATALEQAAQAGALNDQQIGSYLHANTIASGSKD